MGSKLISYVFKRDREKCVISPSSTDVFLLFYEVTKSMLEKKVRLLNLLEFTLKIALHTFQLVLDTSMLPVK